MNYELSREFAKDARKQPSVRKRLAELIYRVEKAESLAEIPNCKKMQGHENYYRVRIGHYRAGIRMEGGKVVFRRLLHRKDIYRYFP
jgi:mRNA interferase RelE/StbE